MTVIYEHSVDFIREACFFLNRYCEHEDFIVLKEELQKKSGYTKEIENVLNEMNQIYQEILHGLGSDVKEKILQYSFYFLSTMEDEEGLNPPIADCMTFESFSIEEKSLEEYKILIKEKFKERPITFIECISGIDESTENYNEEKVLQLVDDSNLKDEMKWKVFQVYHNFEKHLDIVMDIIGNVVPVMYSIYAQHEQVFAYFEAYWKEKCEQGRFIEAMQVHVKYEMEEDISLTVRPSWMGCNGLRMMALNRRDMLYVLIGLMYTDVNIVNNKEMTMEEACSRIKLLSDPSKYEILKLIKKEGLYGSQLAEKLKLTTATISHHVSALSNAALIAYEKDSNRIYYRSNKEQIGYLLDQMRRDLYDD